jgi:hypothetical protein
MKLPQIAPKQVRRIESSNLIWTSQKLSARIAERFPDSGLASVSAQTAVITEETVARAARLAAPRWILRAFGFIGCCIVFALTVAIAVHVGNQASAEGATGTAWIQIIESAVNDVIFVALAIAFLSQVESRVKRAEALRSIRTLRSLAHVIDLHQLSKDPLRLHQTELTPTAHSTPALLTQTELERYLQYCVELLSIVGVLAAIHAQELNDPVVIAATGDIESLTLGLSEKIWSKISVSRSAGSSPS